MKAVYPHSTLAELVLERPERAGLFDRLGVNYCCRGDRPLAAACSQRGLDYQVVAEMLATAPEDDDRSQIDLKQLTLQELCDWLERSCHVALRDRLSRLERAMTRLVEGRGRLEPRLIRMDAVLAILAQTLRSQIAQDQRRLLPLARARIGEEERDSSLSEELQLACSDISASHSRVSSALEVLRGLIDGHFAALGLGREMRELSEGLRQLIAQTRLFFHARNNALLPKVRSAR